MNLAQFWNYKYLADAFALVKTASSRSIAKTDWTNTLSVFIGGHRGHSNGKTRLQMLFPLPKLTANKCAFCQKGKKKKWSPVEKLFLCWVQVSGSLCGPKSSVCFLVLFSQDCLGIIILLLIQCLLRLILRITDNQNLFWVLQIIMLLIIVIPFPGLLAKRK